MRVSAKSVIVELLSAGPIIGDSIPVRQLVRAAQAFDIAENSVRVAIVRLRADGIVESSERGHYQLGPAARPVDERVKRWRDAEAASTSAAPIRPIKRRRSGSSSPPSWRPSG